MISIIQHKVLNCTYYNILSSALFKQDLKINLSCQLDQFQNMAVKAIQGGAEKLLA